MLEERYAVTKDSTLLVLYLNDKKAGLWLVDVKATKVIIQNLKQSNTIK